jgi:fatty acid hydroxylase family protein
MSIELAEVALRHGRAKKRNNAIAATLCGVLPAVLLGLTFTCTGERWLFGLIVGLVWGNAFEYAYHRWLLHRPRSRLSAGHREHHALIGTPEQAEHVTLGSSPLDIVMLFATNGVLAVLISFPLGLWGVLSGVFSGWTIYLIMAEEIHWRIHMNGWLPPGLQFARAYHMSHHDIPNSRYNVFLPLFDLLFGNTGLGKSCQNGGIRTG